MNISMVPVGDLSPDPRNHRLHPQPQIAKIARSIRRLGFRQPLVARNGVIVIGHARLEAAKSLGLAEVPVVPADDLTEAEARALMVADNRLADEAYDDSALLASTLAGLRDEDDLLEVAGVDEADAALLLSALEAPVEPEVGAADAGSEDQPEPEPPEIGAERGSGSTNAPEADHSDLEAGEIAAQGDSGDPDEAGAGDPDASPFYGPLDVSFRLRSAEGAEMWRAWLKARRREFPGADGDGAVIEAWLRSL